MPTLEKAENPVYMTADENFIHLKVKFTEFAETIDFVAAYNDPMEYGVDLFNRAAAGEFGEIAPYQPPPNNQSGTSSPA